MIPKKLTIKNLFSYDDVQLDFNFSSALIVGKNGAGKSSLLESIAFCLYGKSKYKITDKVVKRGRKLAVVTLEFEHDGRIYKVIRKRHSKFASQNSVEFFEILSSGKEEPIKGDTNKEIDSKIKGVVKSSYEIFINSTYFRQGHMSEFLTGTAKKRQEIISQVLNLDRWDNYVDIANKELKEVGKDLSVAKYKYKSLKDSESNLLECESKIKSNGDLHKEFLSKESVCLSAIKALEQKINGEKDKQEQLRFYVDALEKEKQIKKKLGELDSLIASKEKLIVTARCELKKNEEAILDIDEQVNAIIPNLDLKDKIAGLDEKTALLVELRVGYSQLKKQIKNLEENDICTSCGHSHSSLKKKNEEIDKFSKEATKLKSRIDKGAVVVLKMTKIQDLIRQTELEIDKYKSRVKNIENNIKMQNLRIESADSEKTILLSSRSDYELQKKTIAKVLEEYKDISQESFIDNLQDKLSTLRVEAEELSDSISNLVRSAGALEEKKNNFISEVKEKELVGVELAKLNEDATVLSSLVRGFGKKGIQAIIIDNVMGELAKVTNDMLNQFTTVPTYVEFTTQKKDSKDSWKETLEFSIRTPSGVSDFEGLSGGEAFRVAFCIRLALSQIQSRRMGGEAQILMLDEVSSSLDPEGIDSFVSIVKKLEKEVKVMVITHNDALKEEFENIVYVEKDGDTSRLSYC